MKRTVLVLIIVLLIGLYTVHVFEAVAIRALSADSGEYIVYFSSASDLERVRGVGCSIENVFWGIKAALISCSASSANALRGFGVAVVPNINVSISATLASVRVLGPLERFAQVGEGYTAPSAWSWAVSRVGAELVWKHLGVAGEGVVIAVLDTGVDPTHPLLLGKVAGWIEFDRKGRPVCSAPHDTHGHGTWVSSIAVGGDGASYVFGIAPKARVIVGLVLPGGYGSAAQVLAGLNWVLKPVDCSGKPLNVGRVAAVSMSFGASGNYSNVFLPAIAKLIESGIVPVAAIGNDGPYSSSNPGNIWGVIGVGATNYNDEVAWFSSYEEVEWPQPPESWSFKGGYPKTYKKPDLVAPGVDVVGAWPGGLIAIGSGTSASTPIVAAIAAMASGILYGKGLRGVRLVEQVYDILTTTAEKLEEAGAGHGLVNAFKALANAMGYTVKEFTLSAYPTSSKPLSTVRISLDLSTSITTFSVYIAGAEVYRGSYTPGKIIEVVAPLTHYAGNEVLAVGYSETVFYFSKALLYIEPVLIVRNTSIATGEKLGVVASGLGVGDLITISLGNNILSLDMANLRGSYQASFTAPYVAKSSWFNITLYDFSTPTIVIMERVLISPPKPAEIVKQVVINKTEVFNNFLPIAVRVKNYYISGEEGYIEIASPLNITIASVALVTVVKGSATVEFVNVTTVSRGVYRVWIRPELVSCAEAEAVIELELQINNSTLSYPLTVTVVSQSPEKELTKSIATQIQNLNNTVSSVETRIDSKLRALSQEINNVKNFANTTCKALEEQLIKAVKASEELRSAVKQLQIAIATTAILTVIAIAIAVTVTFKARK